MRRDTIVAAVVAAAIASTVAWAAAPTPSPDGSDQPIAEPTTEQVVAAPDEAKARTVQQKMLAQLRAIDRELHLMNHRSYVANHNIVVIAKRQDLGNERLRILNQNLFVQPTSEQRGVLSKSGYLGRIAQAMWALCTQQSVTNHQWDYCDENNYPAPSPGR